MILVDIGVIVQRLCEDSMNQETSHFIINLAIAAFAMVVGLIIIAIGWTIDVWVGDNKTLEDTLNLSYIHLESE